MLDLTVPMVEVWFSGAKLSEHASDVEALKAASLHADSLPLLAESVEYELRRDTMKYIVHRRITGPDAPALGPVLTISDTALTVTLDRPASGPTTIDRYELERYNGSAWVQIASGLSIFGAGMAYPDSGLSASTAYQYRARAVDTTERASEYSYSSGTTSSGVANQAPVWTSPINLSLQQGSSVSIAGYASDPEGDQLTFAKVSSSPSAANIVLISGPGVMTATAACPAGVYVLTVEASDGALATNGTITLTVTAASTGTNFDIATGVPTFDAATAGVRPGDTITVLRGTGTRGPLKITGISGTLANPITVRGDTSGVVTIRRSAGLSSGFVFHLDNPRYCVVDGYLASASRGCGIKVMSATNTATNKDNPASWLQVGGRFTDVRVRYVEVDGGYPTKSDRGVGIQCKDGTITRQANPGDWRENMVVEYCYVHDTGNSAMYLGGNYVANELPWKNATVRYNTIANIGNAGITAKCWWDGTNLIHNNSIDTTGTFPVNPNQRCGISVMSGTADLYNNTILDASAGGNDQTPNGVQCFTDIGPLAGVTETGYGAYTTFVVRAYNNVIARAADKGLNANKNGSCTPVEPYFYNNTVVSCGGIGISTTSTSGGFVRNNIALSNGTNISGSATATNNLTTGSLSSVFTAPESDNYHLSAERAAVDGTGTDISATDIEGTSRAGTASKGAYEYS
jgi:parallel beta-helix repeat protein